MRVDRAGVEVVVAVLRVVEVEAAEFPEPREAGDDLLDVHVRRMVAEVDQALRLGAQGLGAEDRCPPVGDDGGIEGRLVELVLDEHAASPPGRAA